MIEWPVLSLVMVFFGFLLRVSLPNVCGLELTVEDCFSATESWVIGHVMLEVYVFGSRGSRWLDEDEHSRSRPSLSSSPSS